MFSFRFQAKRGREACRRHAARRDIALTGSSKIEAADKTHLKLLFPRNVTAGSFASRKLPPRNPTREKMQPENPTAFTYSNNAFSSSFTVFRYTSQFFFINSLISGTICDQPAAANGTFTFFAISYPGFISSTISISSGLKP